MFPKLGRRQINFNNKRRIMTVLSQNNSIIKSLGGDILDPAATVNNKILHIDTDLQFPNRIHKSATDNKVKQITDKAQGIIFAQTTANKPTYKYEGCLSFDGGDGLHSLPVNLNLGSEWDLEFWFRPQSFAEGAIQFIYRIGEGTVLAYCYFSVNSGVYTFTTNLGNISVPAFGIPAPTLNTWHHLYFSLKSGYIHAYYDGYFITASTFSFTNQLTTISLGRNYNTLYPMTADITFFKISNNARYYGLVTAGTKVFNPVFNTGFTHIQRYSEDGFKKLFISSKYLKDAVIDSADVVEKLYASNRGLNNVSVPHSCYMRQETSGNRPVITKQGLKFTRAAATFIRAANDSALGVPFGYNWWTYSAVSSWYFGGWHRPESNNGSQWFARFGLNEGYNGFQLLWANSANNKYTFFNGVVLEPNITFALNTFNHIAACKIAGDKTYCFINGILVGTLTNAADIAATFIGMMLGRSSNSYNASDCTMDDWLLDINSPIIDPTGYTIGDKVFEPPTRGGFDGTFKIY